jgi:ABC-type phosphate transport system substrate-binding protein
MRTRTLITGAAFLAAGLASVSTAFALPELRGSDTLEDVTEAVITQCQTDHGLPAGSIVYVGGGSGTGQSAMAAGTQHVAPMSRQLNGAQCTAASRQLLVGLDGLSIVAKNSTGGNPATCTDAIGTQDVTCDADTDCAAGQTCGSGNGSGICSASPFAACNDTTPCTAPQTCIRRCSGSPGAAFQLTGVPSSYVPCAADATCVTAFGAGATCDTVRQFCAVGGPVAGCTAAQGCTSAGVYTFDNGTPTNPADDWQDVLRQIYGGMNHTSAATLINVPNTDPNALNGDGTYICQTFTVAVDGGACSATTLCPAGQFCDAGVCKHQVAAGGSRNCARNPARIDCANPVRAVLLASYGQVIRNPLCTSSSPACVKIRHAFRRDDLSGTTDAFQAIVGLVAIAPPTTIRSTAGGAEVADFAATASPFCNAGTAAMNKGFSDGLDLDPIRRACSTSGAPSNTSFEAVCQGYQVPTANSDVQCYTATVTPATYPQRDLSAPQGRGILPGGSVNTLAAMQAAQRSTPPRCLGVVLPISVPQELPGGTVWAANRYTQGGGICTTGALDTKNPLPARQMLCPDGTVKTGGGLCFLTVNTTLARNDCTVDTPPTGIVVPLDGGAPSLQDRRAWNIMPVNNVGQMAQLLDSYQNPNFAAAPTTGASTLRRFARRYYGINMLRPDTRFAPATIATGCTEETDTNQIGCLVKANPCSLGFAGREAADDGGTFANVSLRVNSIQPTNANVENLSTGGLPVYPLSRKLWFNSFTDPVVGFLSPNLTADELLLSQCMGLPGLCTTDADCTGTLPPAGNGLPPCNAATGRCSAGRNNIIDAAITASNFIPVPAGVSRMALPGCPLP